MNTARRRPAGVGGRPPGTAGQGDRARPGPVMDTTPLRDAYRELIDAAVAVADAGPGTPPPPGEWDADQVLAHVCLVTAATIASTACIAAGTDTTYDNRAASDTWTIDRLVDRAGGTAGLRERLRVQGDALCALGGSMGEPELETPVPTLLLSHGAVLVEQPLRLRELLHGLADGELPGHRRQLLARFEGVPGVGAP